MVKYVLLLLFVGMLVGGGIWGMKKSGTVGDFFLGGRKVGPWLSAFAYGTTYFSAVIFIGYAGKVGWSFGLSGLWIVVGNTLVGSLLAWVVLARRTRSMTDKLGAMTLPEFLEARYQNRSLKLVAAIIIFVFLIPYSASVYMGLSYLFNQIFNIPYFYACLFMCLLTAVYLVLGGYRAVALTDLVQGIIMLGGVVLLVGSVLAAPQVGGLRAGLTKLAAIDPALIAPVGPGGLGPLLALVILTSLGVWGMPQMVQKFYAIRDEIAIRPAMIVATTFALVITFGAYFTGAMTHLFFDRLPLDPSNGKPTPDMLMPILIDTILPEAGAAIILLLVLSASMSTLASLVLVASSAVVIDLMRTLWPQTVKKQGVTYLRLFCFLFVLLSFVLAQTKPAIILSLMAMSWGSVAGAFLAPYLFGLFWSRTTTTGAWAGMLSGIFISVVGSLYYKLNAAVIPTMGCLAMLVPLLIVPLVSLFTRPLPYEHVAYIFGGREAPSAYRREAETYTG